MNGAARRRTRIRRIRQPDGTDQVPAPQANPKDSPARPAHALR
jgi:hypothetical protein